MKLSIKREISGSSSHLLVCCAKASQGLSEPLAAEAAIVLFNASSTSDAAGGSLSVAARLVFGGGLGAFSCGNTLVALGALDSQGKTCLGGEGGLAGAKSVAASWPVDCFRAEESVAAGWFCVREPSCDLASVPVGWFDVES